MPSRFQFSAVPPLSGPLGLPLALASPPEEMVIEPEDDLGTLIPREAGSEQYVAGAGVVEGPLRGQSAAVHAAGVLVAGVLHFCSCCHLRRYHRLRRQTRKQRDLQQHLNASGGHSQKQLKKERLLKPVRAGFLATAMTASGALVGSSFWTGGGDCGLLLSSRFSRASSSSRNACWRASSSSSSSFTFSSGTSSTDCCCGKCGGGGGS